MYSQGDLRILAVEWQGPGKGDLVTSPSDKIQWLGLTAIGLTRVNGEGFGHGFSSFPPLGDFLSNHLSLITGEYSIPYYSIIIHFPLHIP